MTTKFEQSIYKNYISTHFASFSPELKHSYTSRYYLWASYMTDLLPTDKNSRILEIGCGMGHNLYALERLGYTHVSGFDISQECIDFCKKQHFNMVESRNIQEVIKKTNPKNRYDVIVVYDLIEHLSPEEAVDFLHDTKKLLTPDGTILISTPNGEFPYNMPIRYVDISHKFLYTYSSLSQVMVLSGLKIDALKSVPSFTIIDDNPVKEFFKRFVMVPFSKIGGFITKVHLYSYGNTLHYPEPQLLCLVKIK